MSIEKARVYAVGLHQRKGCDYNGLPYSVHLELVVNQAERWGFPEELIEACYLHDTIEDCGITYNDIRTEFGEIIADVVYDVSNEMGKSRTERAMRTYPKIQSNPKAVLVKCADRYANTLYSKESGSSMYKKYKSEYETFRRVLMPFGGNEQIWKDLDELNEYNGN